MNDDTKSPEEAPEFTGNPEFGVVDVEAGE